MTESSTITITYPLDNTSPMMGTYPYPMNSGATVWLRSPLSIGKEAFDYSFEACEKLFAIYKSNADLPPAVKNNLPSGAQTVWRKAFNSALEQYGNEKQAAKVAWSAVKKSGYKKSGDKWVKSETESESESESKKEGDVLAEESLDAKTPADIEHKTPPKGYPTSKSQYADPKRYKYPLDTEKHARAALSYWSKPANRKGYSPEEQRAIWSRILRACKKFGIEVSKKKAASIEEDMTASIDESLPAEWVVAGKIYEDGEIRVVEAVPFDSGVNKNGWGMTEDAMRKMLSDSAGKPVTWSHTDDPMCRDEPIGKVLGTIPAGLDSKDDHIKLEISDEEAISKIDSGQWDAIGVSIGAKAPVDSILCSDCKKPYYECDEHPDAYKLVSDGFVDHWAVVKNPAFEGAGFLDFLSSLNASFEAIGGELGESGEKSEEDYIEISPNSDLVLELTKEKETELNKMDEKKAEAETASAKEEQKEDPKVKELSDRVKTLEAENKTLSERVEAYEKSEKDKLIAELRSIDSGADEKELSAMDKGTIGKLLASAKRVAEKAAEKVKAEMDSSNPVRPDVVETPAGKAPTKEEVEKAFAAKKMGIDVDSFLKGYGKK